MNRVFKSWGVSKVLRQLPLCVSKERSAQP